MSLWDFSNTHVTFDNPNYFWDGSIFYSANLYMPSLVGEEYREALGLLESSGIVNPLLIQYYGSYPVTIDWIAPIKGIPAGTVTAQSIYPGTSIQAVNLPITLTVTEFPISVAFP